MTINQQFLNKKYPTKGDKEKVKEINIDGFCQNN